MTQDTDYTRIAFYREEDGNILAVMTDQREYDWYPCYSHVGQHSRAHKDYIKELVIANRQQYWFLFYELEKQIGYKIKLSYIHNPDYIKPTHI